MSVPWLRPVSGRQEWRPHQKRRPYRNSCDSSFGVVEIVGNGGRWMEAFTRSLTVERRS